MPIIKAGPYDVDYAEAGKGPAVLLPRAFVRNGDRVEVSGPAVAIDPFAQQRRAVDDVNRQLAERVLVRKVAPEHVVRIQPADGLERQRLQPPRLERGVVVVRRVLGVDHHAIAELAGMFVKCGLEPALAQPATAQPVRCETLHFSHHRAGVDIGRAKQL